MPPATVRSTAPTASATRITIGRCESVSWRLMVSEGERWKSDFIEGYCHGNPQCQVPAQMVRFENSASATKVTWPRLGRKMSRKPLFSFNDTRGNLQALAIQNKPGLIRDLVVELHRSFVRLVGVPIYSTAARILCALIDAFN